MIKTLQGQQKVIENQTVNIKKLTTAPTDRRQNVQPQPVSAVGPEPTQVVTGVISVEHQDTLPETALQEVDPALNLTCQTSPLPLRVRQQEGTVLALLVPCSYLELSMREQLVVVN